MVAWRAGASDLGTALVGGQILFAGVCFWFACHGTRNQLKRLKQQVPAGGTEARQAEEAA